MWFNFVSIESERQLPSVLGHSSLFEVLAFCSVPIEFSEEKFSYEDLRCSLCGFYIPQYSNIVTSLYILIKS